LLNNHRLWTTYVNLGTFYHKNYFREEKKNLLFLVFSRIYITFLNDQYINRYLLQLSVAETYRKHSFKHANYFNVSSNYNNEQIFAEQQPKVILFPHFIIMSGCFEHDVHQINDLLLRWIFYIYSHLLGLKMLVFGIGKRDN